ncbi:MAG: F0F1 ATP synthase subunit delta [Peptococcaceae bacterium]|nr:F0F1 ATP synthase subunit delta [Peptococcaceae bacterium]
MIKGAVATRYAQALFDIARDKKQIEEIEGELNTFIQALDESHDLQQLVYHPQVPFAMKKDVLATLFKDTLSETTFNFICLVLERRREPYLKAIAEQYLKLAYETRNIAEADVVSAVEVPSNVKDDLVNTLSTMTGKEVRVNYAVDPEILGGLVIRLGDRIIDASVKRQLEKVHESIREIQIG